MVIFAIFDSIFRDNLYICHVLFVRVKTKSRVWHFAVFYVLSFLLKYRYRLFVFGIITWYYLVLSEYLVHLMRGRLLFYLKMKSLVSLLEYLATIPEQKPEGCMFCIL